MTDQEFDQLLSTAVAELETKQSRLQSAYDLGNLPRWWFDQEQEHLQFTDGTGNVALEAAVVPLGSHSPRTNTWKWAWSNDSLLPSLREKAEPLKQLRVATGFELFISEGLIEADEHKAWDLAALGVMHLAAEGCYRAPISEGSGYTFLAITSLRKVLR